MTSLLRPLISKIEVERKFIPTRLLLQALKDPRPKNPPPPSISRIRPAGVQFIRDVYYDRHDRLSEKGLWVRERSVVGSSSSSAAVKSSWEAKARVGGDYVASQFVEVEGVEGVERELQRVLSATERTVKVHRIHEHLDVLCDLTTRRMSGELEMEWGGGIVGRNGLKILNVAIDQVVETTSGDFAAARAALESRGTLPDDAFFHEIGELEVMTEVHTEGSEQEHVHETRRKEVASTLAEQLDEFMRAHPTLFPMTPRPRGKLVAYFAWREGQRR
ncbi:CYTH domain-containing protein [Favolaschia claudopus]|uniref:CYTH domain-containing protein n=1 Tax=Favolaschia claudopus TaxID=2862362 RepID=A0AAW0BC61_9AGAR